MQGFLSARAYQKKRSEDIRNEGDIDAVLTFNELAQWFDDKCIRLPELTEDKFDEKTGITRLYPKNGGVIRCMKARWKLTDTKDISDGMENCMEALNALRDGGLEGCMMSFLPVTGVV
jgi:iron only hydrogenase large subunit-like protein